MSFNPKLTESDVTSIKSGMTDCLKLNLWAIPIGLIKKHLQKRYLFKRYTTKDKVESVINQCAKLFFGSRAGNMDYWPNYRKFLTFKEDPWLIMSQHFFTLFKDSTLETQQLLLKSATKLVELSRKQNLKSNILNANLDTSLEDLDRYFTGNPSNGNKDLYFYNDEISIIFRYGYGGVQLVTFLKKS